MPRATTSYDHRGTTQIIRDAHDESGTVVVKRTSFDDEILEANKKARLGDKTVKTGDKLGIHDDAEIVYAFSIPADQWRLFKRDHPDIVRGIHSRNQLVREKACADLRALRPGWVFAAPGRHHF